MVDYFSVSRSLADKVKNSFNSRICPLRDKFSHFYFGNVLRRVLDKHISSHFCKQAPPNGSRKTADIMLNFCAISITYKSKLNLVLLFGSICLELTVTVYKRCHHFRNMLNNKRKCFFFRTQEEYIGILQANERNLEKYGN